MHSDRAPRELSRLESYTDKNPYFKFNANRKKAVCEINDVSLLTNLGWYNLSDLKDTTMVVLCTEKAAGLIDANGGFDEVVRANLALLRFLRGEENAAKDLYLETLARTEKRHEYINAIMKDIQLIDNLFPELDERCYSKKLCICFELGKKVQRHPTAKGDNAFSASIILLPVG